MGDNGDGFNDWGWGWQEVPNQPWSFEPLKIDSKAKNETKENGNPLYRNGFPSPVSPDPLKDQKGKVGVDTTVKKGKDLFNRTFLNYQGDGWTNKAGLAIGGGVEYPVSVAGDGIDTGAKITAGIRLQDQFAEKGPLFDFKGNAQASAVVEGGGKFKVNQDGINAGVDAFAGAKAGIDGGFSKWGITLGGGVEGQAGFGYSGKMVFGKNEKTGNYEFGFGAGAADVLGFKGNVGISIDPKVVGPELTNISRGVGNTIVKGVEYPSRMIPVGTMVTAANKAATVAAPIVSAAEHPVTTLTTAANKAATVAAPIVNAAEHPVTTLTTAANKAATVAAPIVNAAEHPVATITTVADKAATVAAPIVNAAEHPVTTLTTAANKVENAVVHPSTIVNSAKDKAKSAWNGLKNMFSEGGEVNVAGLSNELSMLRGLGTSYLPSQELLTKVKADSGSLFGGSQRTLDRRMHLQITPANGMRKPSGARSEGSSLIASGLGRSGR